MISKKHSILILICSILSVLFIGLNQENQSLLASFSKFTVMDIVYVSAFFILFSYTNKSNDKRAKICSGILAIIFALCEVIGYSITRYWNLSCVIGSKTIFLKTILKLIGYSIVFYNVILLAFSKGIPKLKKLENKELDIFSNNKKSFVLVMIAILVCYLPYYLSQFPGIISTDSVAEISTALFSMNNMVNHHPVFHIAIVSIFMNIGRILNNYIIGIGLYSFCQMVFTASVFSFTLYYMAKKGVNFYIRLIAFLIFALYPPFACYSITMWKDVPFGIVMLLYTICMIELATNTRWLESKWKNILFILTMILVILFRNNGVYVILLSIPFMIYWAKGYRKTMSIISIIIIIFYVIFKGPIFKLFNITDGPIREALSVPVQQIARTVKYRGEELTQEEKDRINKYLPINEIGEAYYPIISDNVKDKLNNEAVKENKVDFISLWIELFFKYPREYVEAFLSGAIGYWYPEEKNWVVWDDEGTSYNLGTENLGINIYQKPLLKIRIIDALIDHMDSDSTTVIGSIFSIGFICWIILALLVYVIYKKNYRLILMFLPALFLWCTTIASPVWCEYRYIYSAFTCVILLIAMTITLTNKEK